MKSVIGAVVGVVILYLLGAFIAWDFNAGNWQEDGRAFGALVSLGWIGFCGIMGSEL